MSLVVAGEGLNGFAGMVAGLIEGNIQSDPDRAALIKGSRGTVALHAADVEASAVLVFAGGVVTIGNEQNGPAALEIIANAEQMMAFTTTPLRMGLPDVMTPEGRDLTKRILTGDIKVRGMVRNLGLVRRVNRLLSVR